MTLFCAAAPVTFTEPDIPLPPVSTPSASASAAPTTSAAIEITYAYVELMPTATATAKSAIARAGVRSMDEAAVSVGTDSGGVAANGPLREALRTAGEELDVPVYLPSRAMCTDNASMIAAAAWPKLLARDFASEDLGATPQLRLG